MDELDCDVLRVGAGGAVTEDHQSAATVETNSHGVTCSGYRGGIISKLIKR
jgi:hypothetical protein